ncbi:hypothetical protein L0222_22225 [bacterium]|nr:hypothetical protein [bacterium]MCI0601975.1 hypothetical protein [bacterium]
MKHQDDSDLRKIFEEIRRFDQQNLPSFRRLRSKERRSSQTPFPVYVTSAVLTIILLGISLHYFSPGPQIVKVSSLEEWKAPTDFLLRTPGIEVIEMVPNLESSVLPDSVIKQNKE